MKGGWQRYQLSSEKNIRVHTSSAGGQLKVTDLRYFLAFVQFLPSSNHLFFFFFALQGKGKKKQIDGNKIFNDRNENKLLLTFSRAQLPVVNSAPFPSCILHSNEKHFQFLSMLHKILAPQSQFLRLNKVKVI